MTNPNQPLERPHFPPPTFPPPPPPGPQQTPPGGVHAGPRPQTQPSARWALTIAGTVLFFPIGAIALIFSSQTSSKWNAGDAQGAQQASQRALNWGLIFTVLGVFGLLVVLA